VVIADGPIIAYKKIQDGGRSRSQKTDKLLYLGNSLTDGQEIWQVDAN